MSSSHSSRHGDSVVLVLLVIAGAAGCTTPTPGTFSYHDLPWIDVAVGPHQTCGLTEEGDVWCWGCREGHPDHAFDSGQCAHPAERYREMSAGGYHTCAVANDGHVDCWGCELADADFGQCDAPAGAFSTVSAGWEQTCALTTDGEIRCWGCGLDLAYQDFVAPEACAPPSGTFVDLSGTVALTAGGEVVGWGGWGGEILWEPALPAPLVRIETGGDLCGLTADGVVVCLGELQVDAPDGAFMDLATGALYNDNAYACALAIDGSVSCWGEPWTASILDPPADERFRSISTNDDVVCGATVDGRIVCWGEDLFFRRMEMPQ